jgi:hypothetical protein
MESLAGSSTSSARASLTYFIPKPPPGKRVGSARLRLFANVVSGEVSGLQLSGMPPTSIEVLSCSGSPNCNLWVTWDFTEEAGRLAGQGGGHLDLSLDPIPPTVLGPDISRAWYVLFPDVNYPWFHGGASGALTVTFVEDCPKELQIEVDSESVRPELPAGSSIPAFLRSIPTKATVTARVKSCPSESGAPPPSVEVTFEIVAPASGTPEAGGHDLVHNGQRPKGTFEKSPSAGGQSTATCTVTSFDAAGVGTCKVTYYSNEVSGVEKITGRASGFPGAEVAISVEVPGLMDLPEAPARYVLVGAPNNHAGTNDPCRATPPLSRHFQNHFGRPQLNVAVVAIADRILQQTGILLRVNDASLALGGLFDINNNWRTPHRTHRVGGDVDIGFSGVRNGVCTEYDRLQLQREIVRSTRNDPVEEGDHFHAFVR